MSTTEATIQPITKAEIAALRTCDDICYRYSKSEGISQLEAVKRASSDNVWEQRVSIPVTTTIESYQKDVLVERAFAGMTRYNFVWDGLRTVLDLLRPGDILQAVLLVGNNSDYLTQAGLFHDTLSLRITRGKKTNYVIGVYDSVCPNNSARLVQVRQLRPGEYAHYNG